ncbi:DUF262 domain-containing protein [Vallitalea sp.]|jgi:hypothetical protein|uniref:DUF262 domain-containing protein n=1 Tax=Vallitalea sp. TaxID=1882829 RepID=UPI0025E7597E|nr:DUF262 domain-containing protein [Vallitalea sp.]MCT4687303.1 DUF262 domain-containing protein [Vallitalea sp.]
MENDRLQLEENNIQLAENEHVDDSEKANDSEKKRKLLEDTKIVKQTWSIIEIYQKIDSKKLILDPHYQRNNIWKIDKQVSFIESLFMGIVIPPIYVVEIPEEDLLKGNKYEVVDGKQRLNTIKDFLENQICLKEKHLEYYADIYGNKTFSAIKNEYNEQIKEFLSSVLDVYVITANSPEFTKYDIFARLNKGSEKLKVNEIRKAIYSCKVLRKIEDFIEQRVEGEKFEEERFREEQNKYKEIFTPNDIKRYEDYGRFFSSIAYYLRMNINDKVINGYNSRPREMINTILAELQQNPERLQDEELDKILEQTIKLMLNLKNKVPVKYIKNLTDVCIYFAVKREDFYNFFDKIISDDEIIKSLEKSPTTTSNVNKRVKRISDILNEQSN